MGNPFNHVDQAVAPLVSSLSGVYIRIFAQDRSDPQILLWKGIMGLVPEQCDE